jgi:hypothetical protein
VCSDELGKYNGGPVKLHIDNNVRLVAQRNRKNSFSPEAQGGKRDSDTA